MGRGGVGSFYLRDESGGCIFELPSFHVLFDLQFNCAPTGVNYVQLFWRDGNFFCPRRPGDEVRPCGCVSHGYFLETVNLSSELLNTELGQSRQLECLAQRKEAESRAVLFHQSEKGFAQIGRQ